VKMLLGQADIEPDEPGESALTPLCCAAQSGCEGVARILLGRGDVSPDGPDDGGRTPLWWAACNGR